MNDKSLTVIYNASAYEAAKDEKIKAFLHFISTNNPGKDDFTNRLSKLVEKIKDNEKFRTDYAAMNLHDRDIQRAAKKEGKHEKAIESALKMLADGMTPELVAKYVDLSVNEIQELQIKQMQPQLQQAFLNLQLVQM